MTGLFAVATVSLWLRLSESAFHPHQERGQLQDSQNGALSSKIRRYLLQNHVNVVGFSSGHIPSTTQSNHVAQHSYVHCGDGRCYHGICRGSISDCRNGPCRSYYECHCYYGYEGHSCELQRVSENRCQDNKLLCGHGECVMDIFDNTYSCHCQSAYTGKECDLHIQSGLHCSHHCQHGQCVTGSWTTRYFCHCYDGYTGSYCNRRTGYPFEWSGVEGKCIDSAASTTTTTTTTSTTTSTTTTTTPPPTTVTSATTAPSTTTTSYLRCKVMTLLDLANQVAVTNPNITSCPSGSFATPEAFVLKHCGVSMPSKWTRGVNVMEVCHNIPLYTPVATFMDTAYSSRGGLSGVFLGCLPNGFKLGAQQCDILPKILHVENGLFTMNPHLYYTVQ